MSDRRVSHLDFAELLEARGVSMLVTVDASGGGHTFPLKAKDVPLFLEDRDAWTAKAWGVTKDIFQQWKHEGGFVRCAGDTKAGRRCKNPVMGAAVPEQLGAAVDPPVFAELLGGYCHLHG